MSEPKETSVSRRLRRQAEQLENLALEAETQSSYQLNSVEEEELRGLVKFLRSELDDLRLANIQNRLQDVEDVLRQLKLDLAKRREEGRPTRVIEAMIWEAENERGRVMASLTHVVNTPSQQLGFHDSSESHRFASPPGPSSGLEGFFRGAGQAYSAEALNVLEYGESRGGRRGAYRSGRPSGERTAWDLDAVNSSLELEVDYLVQRPEDFDFRYLINDKVQYDLSSASDQLGLPPDFDYPVEYSRYAPPEFDSFELNYRPGLDPLASQEFMFDAEQLYRDADYDAESDEYYDSFDPEHEEYESDEYELVESFRRDSELGELERFFDDVDSEIDDDFDDELDEESYESYESLEDEHFTRLDAQLEALERDEFDFEDDLYEDAVYEDELEEDDSFDEELARLEAELDDEIELEEEDSFDIEELDELEVEDDELDLDEELEELGIEEDLEDELAELEEELDVEDELEVEEEELGIEDELAELDVDEDELAVDDEDDGELEVDEDDDEDELDIEDELAEIEVDEEDLDEDELAELEVDEDELAVDDEDDDELEVDEEELDIDDELAELEVDDEDLDEDELAELEVDEDEDEDELAVDDDVDDELTELPAFENVDMAELEASLTEEDLAEFEEAEELEFTEEDLAELEEAEELEFTEEDLAELEEAEELEFTAEDLAELEDSDELEITDDDLAELGDSDELELTDDDLAELGESDELELTDDDLAELEESDELDIEGDLAELEDSDELEAVEDEELEESEALEVTAEDLADLEDGELDELDAELDELDELGEFDLNLDDEDDEDEPLELEAAQGDLLAGPDDTIGTIDEELLGPPVADPQSPLGGELLGPPTDGELLGAPEAADDADVLFSGPPPDSTISDDFFAGPAQAASLGEIEFAQEVEDDDDLDEFDEDDELIEDLDIEDEPEEPVLEAPTKEYRSAILQALRKVQKSDEVKTRQEVLSVLESTVPAEMRQVVSERRRLVRLSCEYDVNCYQGNQIFHATIRDISLGGMKIEVTKQLEQGSELEVSNPNPTAGKGDQRVTAQVRWFRVNNAGKAEAGLQFVDPPEVLGRSWVVSLLNRVGMQSQVFNQRKYTRAVADFPVDVISNDGEVYEGRCVDLGLGGALVDSAPVFEEGDTLLFRCLSFGIHGKLEAKSKVVKVKEMTDDYGSYALEFYDLDAATTKLLGRYVVDLLKLGRATRKKS